MRFILLSILILTGCETLEKIDEELNKPKASYDWDHKADSTMWVKYTRDALVAYGDNLLTKKANDAHLYCPRFNELKKEDRIVFWTGLIAAMSRYESNFKPETSYKESFKDRNGDYVISRGLLQISQESANGSRYKCGITKASQLNDPKTNLTCGVKILEGLFREDFDIATKRNGDWKGGARYWSVLRPRSGSKVYKIREVVKAMDVCKKDQTSTLKPAPIKKPAYGLHSVEWSRFFIEKCDKRVKNHKYCEEIVKPNKNSISSFRAVYGTKVEHLLMPKEDKFETGIRLLEILEQAQKLDSKIKVCQIANWYRPKAYNSRVGGAKSSQHLWANAIDIHFCSRDARNRGIKAFLELEKKYKTLGIGTYRSSSSVTIHIDFATRNYGPK